jgi:hypothetical protein
VAKCGEFTLCFTKKRLAKSSLRKQRRYPNEKKLILIGLLSIVLAVAISGPAAGSDIEARLQALEETLKKQEETIKGQQKVIDGLKEQIKTAGPASVADVAGTIEKPVDLQRPAEEGAKSDEKLYGTQKTTKSTGLFSGSYMMNPNISLVLNTFAQSSNLSNEELRNHGVPGFTTEGIERKNGFNLEAAELYLYAPVDPYFNLYATIPVTEGGAEVEEAYFVTTSLPTGHQIKGGKFKSGFGRLNAFHPHAWDFVDAPLPYRAFLGGEGLIEKGVQYTYLAPLPFYTVLGAEVLQGENKTLFGADAANGAHEYALFAKASLDVSDHGTILFGPSLVTGKTKTDTVTANSDFTGDSTLYGFEFTYKWKPSKDQGFKLQSEYLYRTQSGDLTDTTLGSVQRLSRNQDGLYVQGVYLWDRWELGARYDTLNIFHDDYSLDGTKQDFGRRPWRATGMVDYKFSEFSLLRLQYNHDESNVNGRINDEVFLQAVFSIGAHGAHQF